MENIIVGAAIVDTIFLPFFDILAQMHQKMPKNDKIPKIRQIDNEIKRVKM